MGYRRKAISMGLITSMFLAFVLVGLNVNVPPAQAQTTTLSIEPSPVAVTACTNFTVGVKVNYVTDLYSWQMNLTFDPTLMTCVGATAGPFLPPPTFGLIVIIDNTAGWVAAADSRMVPPGASGSCVLAYITFHCKGQGSSSLHFKPVETFLLDSNYFSIPFDPIDGYVTQLGPSSLHGEDGLLYNVHLHADFLINLMNPICTRWHELWPSYCSHYYHLNSWEDNGDNMLSPSDQIDMIDLRTNKTSWWHVDDVTVTIYVKPTEAPGPAMYLEFTGGFPNYATPLLNPVCTYWHEIYPVFSKKFHLSSWMDNGNGILSFCDKIYLKDPVTGLGAWYHVAQVATDIIVTRKPVCTQWHEIYPEFCAHDYHLSSWIDNGDKKLSPCDKIDMTDKATGNVTWWHVREVTITLILTEKYIPPPLEPMYLEYVPIASPLYEPIFSPVCTYWHEIWPVYCRYYHLSSWEDNGNGFLDPSDQIDMTDEYGKVHWYHVDDVTIDIWVEPIPQPIHDVAVTSVVPQYASIVQGGIDPIKVTVQNQGDFTETFGVKAYYDGNLIGTQTVTLAPASFFDVFFSWDTSTVPVGTYTIKGVADVVPGETDIADNTLTDGKVTVLSPFKILHGEYGLLYKRRLDAETLINLMSPISTMWHELWPYYCRRYHLTSWVDNGDEMLSPSDQIDMFEYETNQTTWWHVDDVTITLYLKDKEGILPPMYIEFEGGFPEYQRVLKYPVCTYWHEVYPYFSRRFHLSSWIDTDGNGMLNPSDQIDMKDLETGKISWWHVERVSTDIIVTRKPICTQWHEIWPDFCMRDFHLSSWEDNGDHKLSPSDQIDLTDKKTGQVTWWHVKHVTITIVLTEKEVPPPIEPMYMEFEGEYLEEILTRPVCTWWHEIWPVYCRYYHLSSWYDNGDGWLSPSDQIDMTDEKGIVHWYHVDDVTIDIWIEPKPPCPMPPRVEWKHKFAIIDYFMTFCPSPGVANLDKDLNLEIVTGTDEWYGNQKWYCFDASGATQWTLPTRVDESRTSVAIGDIDGDGDLEIAGGTTSGWETQVFDSAGSFVWRYSDPTRYDWWHSTPAMCDVNPNSSGLEVIAAEYGVGGNPKIFCFSKTGSVLWSYTIPEGGIVDASPACGDIDGDGVVEIVIGTAPPGGQPHKVYCFNGRTGAVKWTHWVQQPSTCSNRAVHSSAALADIDGDGKTEVIFGANDGGVRCLKGTDGTLKWIYWTGGSVYSSPAVGDVDADGNYEIVVGSNDKYVYCLSSTGTLEWRFKTGGAVISSPALANRGTTPGLGIYVGSKDGYLYLLNGFGNLIWRFNTGATNGITSSPAVADIDGDSKLEVMFTDWNAIPDNAAVTNVFWCLEDCTSWVEPYAVEWPMFRHDRCHTGKYSSGIKGMGGAESEANNVEGFTEIQPLVITHDVAIVFDWLSKSFIKAGETVQVYVDVENQGTSVETTTVSVSYDGTPIGSAPVTLAIGETKTLTFPWDTTGVPKGTYSVTADASVVPGETDTADNTFSTLAIVTLPVHDIAAAYVVPYKTIVCQGYRLRVNVTLFNQGDFPETFIVSASYGSSAIGAPQLIGLGTGLSTTLTFDCDTTGLPKGTDTVGAYIVTPITGETDTADNTRVDGLVTIVIVGDINADGIVDIEDIYTIALAYGTMPGQPGYNPNLDINDDGIIDIQDIYTTALHYGEIDP